MGERPELDSWLHKVDEVLVEEDAKLAELKEQVEAGQIEAEEAEVALRAFHNQVCPDIMGRDL